MTDERCRYCGGIHRCAGDECHPPVDRVLTMLHEAEDEIKRLRKALSRMSHDPVLDSRIENEIKRSKAEEVASDANPLRDH